jgi:hypothetical protein
MLLPSGSGIGVGIVVVAIILVVFAPEPANGADDIAKRVEKLVGEPVRVISHDGLGFPKRIKGLRADSQYEADFDRVLESALRTGAWTVSDGEVNTTSVK